MRTEVFTRIVTSVCGWTAQRSKDRDSRSQYVAMDASGNPVAETLVTVPSFVGLARNATHTNARASAEDHHPRRIDMHRGQMGNFRICMLQGARIAPALNAVDHRIRGCCPAANRLGHSGTPR